MSGIQHSMQQIANAVNDLLHKHEEDPHAEGLSPSGKTSPCVRCFVCKLKEGTQLRFTPVKKGEELLTPSRPDCHPYQEQGTYTKTKVPDDSVLRNSFGIPVIS